MANKKSSKKRVRQNNKRRATNRSSLAAMRTNLKNSLASLSQAKTLDDKKKVFSSIQSLLHKASKKKLIPMNRAARKLGRIAARYLTATK